MEVDSGNGAIDRAWQGSSHLGSRLLASAVVGPDQTPHDWRCVHEYLVGDSFSVADITGMAALLLGEFLKIEIPAALRNVRRWDERVRDRPSWSA